MLEMPLCRRRAVQNVTKVNAFRFHIHDEEVEPEIPEVLRRAKIVVDRWKKSPGLSENEKNAKKRRKSKNVYERNEMRNFYKSQTSGKALPEYFLFLYFFVLFLISRFFRLEC